MRRTFTVRPVDGSDPYEAPGVELLPGLALVEVPTISGESTLYSLTHVRSGLSVEFFDDVEHAGWCANQFLSGVDWTRSGAELRDDSNAKAAFHAVQEHHPTPYRHHRSSDYSDVNS